MNLTPAQKKMAIIGGIAAVIALGIIMLFSKGIGAKNDGIDKATALSAQYRDNQNYLSSYIAGFYEQTGVAKVKADKLNSILLEAVKGRYDGKMAPGTGGTMFSAISEAYPDLSGLNIYDKIVDYVAAGRVGYRNKQSKLLDMLRDWEAWSDKGALHPILVDAFVPMDKFVARVGDKVYRGEEAIEKMNQIVLTQQATDAYESGEDKILTIPDDEG
jgi:hypothetical protein